MSQNLCIIIIELADTEAVMSQSDEYNNEKRIYFNCCVILQRRDINLLIKDTNKDVSYSHVIMNVCLTRCKIAYDPEKKVLNRLNPP